MCFQRLRWLKRYNNQVPKCIGSGTLVGMENELLQRLRFTYHAPINMQGYAVVTVSNVYLKPKILPQSNISGYQNPSKPIKVDIVVGFGGYVTTQRIAAKFCKNQF